VCQRGDVFRLLGVLGGLAMTTDLGVGAPPEESLKRCVVATRLARSLGCGPREVSDVLYTSLLQHLGCTAYSHETGRLWGDDIAFVRLAFMTDFADRSDLWRTWVPGVAATTGWSRPRVLATALTVGRRGMKDGPAATCEIARDASRGLGLPASVQADLFHAMAAWNGTGHPAARGEAIPLPTRITHVASTATLFALHAGTTESVAQLRRRAGSELDPEIVAAFASRADELIGDLDELDAYLAVLDAEPDPVQLVAEARLEGVARTFGHLADLKSPWLHGHSAAVGDLAADAVRHLGLDAHVTATRVAGYLHDLGRVAVPSRVWDKPGQLTVGEREQARMHAYHSERILARVPALAEVAALAGQHHERCDGSGYHRGVTASQLPMPSRALAAADRYRGLVEGRPHRPALSPADAAARLKDDARRGSLDADAVDAVLAAAGHRTGVRRTRPADLTERQVAVLRLMARGLSNRQIGRELVISARTAEHHVQDVYAKIGVSTRAGAALFAMEHGLVDKDG